MNPKKAGLGGGAKRPPPSLFRLEKGPAFLGLMNVLSHVFLPLLF